MTQPLPSHGTLPADWPVDGPIDLALHDLPHASSTTEWWYVNTHLTGANGQAYSLFAAFFRIISGKDASGAPEYAHSLTWALSDVEKNDYVAFSFVDDAAPRIGLDRIKRGQGASDNRLNRAMEEVLNKGKVPRPDRFFPGPVRVSTQSLDLDYGGLTFKKTSDGRYELKLQDTVGARSPVGAKLVFTLERPPTRHGDNGVVRGVHGEDMFYYFVPRCSVTGALTLDGQDVAVASGQGWYDHEFGCPPKRTEAEAKQDALDAQKAGGDHGFIAWNWLSAQLADGTDVSVYDLVRESTGLSAGRWAIIVAPNGARAAYPDFTFTPVDGAWRSTRTFQAYPTGFELDVPAAKLKLSVRAAMADQEVITVISKPGFWEGRCTITGTFNGAQTSGVGFVERSGFNEAKGLDDFFKRVGEAVRASVSRLYPDELTPSHAEALVSAPGRVGVLDGVDLGQLQRTLIAPVRAITDRGGKAWRSYAALACCDVVMGDSRKFAEWLSMPEFIHVGSLIVDDVQDKSTVRRGGPAAHVLFGEAIALNAGTAAYFMGERLLKRSLVTDAQKLALYDLYFEALRAGHAGQAIDLAGLDGFVSPALESGDVVQLEQRVLAVHRLKTALPAALLARMGAVAGGGTAEQIDAVGRYFEAVGLAFQMVDDVLNLRGFENDLKLRGEDLMQGKVTLPVARALGALGAAERSQLWATISSKPQDAATVARCINTIDGCGALDGCMKDARDIVETAWKALDPKVEDSLAKLMLRAFGWYVLERQY